MIDVIVRVFGTDYPHPHCKLLALAVARRCGSETGLCWASAATLMRDTGLRRTAFYRARKLMEDHTVGGVSQPLLKRWVRPNHADGRRRSDLMALRFPSIVLPAMDLELPAAEIESGQLSLWDVADLEAGQFEPEEDPESQMRTGLGLTQNPAGGILQTGESEDASQMRTDSVPNANTEETLEETIDSLPARAPEWPVSEAGVLDPEKAAAYLWSLSPPKSRDRSSLPDAMAAVSLALKSRNPAKLHAGYWFSTLAKAVEFYAASPGAVREDGRYCVALHRLLDQDKFWNEWVPKAKVALAQADKPVENSGRPDDPAMFRLYMQGWQRHRFWPERQGPKPGAIGCLVPDDILREFGVDLEARDVALAAALDEWLAGGVWMRSWGPPPGREGSAVSAEALAAAKARREAEALPKPAENMHENMPDDDDAAFL